MRVHPRLFAIPPVLAGLQAWRAYDRLPDRVATHFNFAGQPDGWMSPQGFFAFYIGLLGFMSLVFGGVPLLVHKLPPRLVNLPNRDYWLAPERRDATIEDLSARTSFFGLLVLLFIVGVHELVLRANLGNGILATTPLWIALAGLFAFAGVWMVRLHRRYRLPP